MALQVTCCWDTGDEALFQTSVVLVCLDDSSYNGLWKCFEGGGVKAEVYGVDGEEDYSAVP